MKDVFAGQFSSSDRSENDQPASPLWKEATEFRHRIWLRMSLFDQQEPAGEHPESWWEAIGNYKKKNFDQDAIVARGKNKTFSNLYSEVEESQFSISYLPTTLISY